MKPTSVSLRKLRESQAYPLCPDCRVTIGADDSILKMQTAYDTLLDLLVRPPASDFMPPVCQLKAENTEILSTSFGIKQSPQYRTSNMDSVLLLTERHFDSRSAHRFETRSFYLTQFISVTDFGDKDPTWSEDPGIKSLFCADSSSPGTQTCGNSAIEFREPPAALSDEAEIMNTVNFDSGGIDRYVRNERGNVLSSSEMSTVTIKPKVPPKVTFNQYSSISTGIHIHQFSNHYSHYFKL